MNRNELKKYLGFNYTQERVFGFGKAEFNRAKYDECLEKLSAISSKDSCEIRLTDNEIKELIERLKLFWKEKKSFSDVKLNPLEALSVGYGIGPGLKDDFIEYLNQVIEIQPVQGRKRGYLYSLLLYWFDFSKRQREIIINFINSASDPSIPGTIAQYLSDSGPSKLGNDLGKRHLPLSMAPAVLNFSGARLSFPYFSDAAISYYEEVENIDYKQLTIDLDVHNNQRTDKILIPNLIVSSRTQDNQLLTLSINRIGDPFDDEKWGAFDGASSSEVRLLRKAQQIALSWIMSRVIKSFFDVLCKDSKRREFWLKNVTKIRDFKVYGSYNSKMQLVQNAQIDMISKHFRSISSSSDNCALVMYFDNFVIIEFTEVGALYAYKRDGKLYRQVFKDASSISKVDDLKVPYLDRLYNQETHHYEAEGKMDHRGDWESRMNFWLDRFL